MRLPTFPDRFDEVQRRVLSDFQLDIMGCHGLPHWSRVMRNGLLIAAADPGVDVEIVTLFALLHDAMRENEYEDVEHGIRAARYTQELADKGYLPMLDKRRLTVLKAAIADHNRGMVLDREDADGRTIQACWDADRLDLGRIGVKPRVQKLGSRYVLADPEGVIQAHWDEAWNTDGMEAMIEAV